MDTDYVYELFNASLSGTNGGGEGCKLGSRYWGKYAIMDDVFIKTGLSKKYVIGVAENLS